MNKALDIGETLKLGWETFTKNAVPLILGFLLAFVVSLVSFGICLGPMMIGFNTMMLKAARGEEVAAGEVFEGFQRFVPAFVLFLIMGIAIVIGFMLLVLPGLVLSFMLAFAPWIMAADEDMGAIDALKASVEMFKRDVGGVLVFVLVASIVYSLGSVVPGAILVTGPVAAAMFAHGTLRAAQSVGETAHAV